MGGTVGERGMIQSPSRAAATIQARDDGGEDGVVVFEGSVIQSRPTL